MLLCLVFFSCDKKQNGIEIDLKPNEIFDTLYVSELITDKPIAEIHEVEEKQIIQLATPTIAEIYSKDKKVSYLSLLVPNRDLDIFVNSDSTLTTRSKSDSLVNYLSKSNLEFVNKNRSLIFETENIDTIPLLFEGFRKKRENEIDKFKNEFTSQEMEILHFQNDARIYGFLLFFGRISKNLDLDNNYFDFIKTIPEPSSTLKSLPDIYLYKFEIEYLKENQSLEDIPSFLKYIENKTGNEDLADYLKAIYLKRLIELPFYWEKHEKLFNSVVLSEVLKSEQNNNYHFLIEQSALVFYSSQSGQPAYNFEAEDKLGSSFNLKELHGKIVFIDVWATWCGPCIAQRPKVIDLAEKFKDNDEVEIIMLSIDSSKDKWLDYLEKEEQEAGLNLFIKNGARAKFRKNYNVKAIPRYILINHTGILVNSEIDHTGNEIEEEIKNLLIEK